jgi:hypothetical protein
VASAGNGHMRDCSQNIFTGVRPDCTCLLDWYYPTESRLGVQNTLASM